MVFRERDFFSFSKNTFCRYPYGASFQRKKKSLCFFRFSLGSLQIFFHFCKTLHILLCINAIYSAPDTKTFSNIHSLDKRKVSFQKKKRKREGTRKKVCEMEINSFSLLFLSFSFSSFSFLRMRWIISQGLRKVKRRQSYPVSSFPFRQVRILSVDHLGEKIFHQVLKKLENSFCKFSRWEEHWIFFFCNKESLASNNNAGTCVCVELFFWIFLLGKSKKCITHMFPSFCIDEKQKFSDQWRLTSFFCNHPKRN